MLSPSPRSCYNSTHYQRRYHYDMSSEQNIVPLMINHNQAHSDQNNVENKNELASYDDASTTTKSPMHDRFNVFRSKIANKMRLRSTPFLRACVAELVGTAMLVIFGCGVLAQVIIGNKNSNEHGDFMSISLGWGMAVMMGVFFAGGGGPGLVNPAVTLAFWVIGKVKPQEILPFSVCQFLGAFFGAIMVYAINFDSIVHYSNREANGDYLMNHTGKIFVTMPADGVSTASAFVDQIFGAALLTSSALAITDNNNWKMPKYLHPFLIGMMVFTLVGSFGLQAGAALNPARDFGPRVAIALLGWGVKAFSNSDYYFWVPLIGPYIGAIIGAVFYEITIGIHLDEAGDKMIDPRDRILIIRRSESRKSKGIVHYDDEQEPLRTNEDRV